MKDFHKTAKSKLDVARDIIIKVNRLKKDLTEDDETNLLNNFRDNMFSYSKLVNDAIEDKLVTGDEMEDIQIIEKKILQDARAIMLEDGKISKGENDLIMKLIELFEKLTLQ